VKLQHAVDDRHNDEWPKYRQQAYREGCDADVDQSSALAGNDADDPSETEWSVGLGANPGCPDEHRFSGPHFAQAQFVNGGWRYALRRRRVREEDNALLRVRAGQQRCRAVGEQ
jgi:hypothetical protein